MTDKKAQYQQQILFDEPSEPLLPPEQPVEHQLIIDNDAWQAMDDDALLLTPEQPAPKPRWLWRLASVLFVLALLIELVDFFYTGFAQAPLSTSLYAAVLACVSLVAGSALFKELKSLRRFRRVQRQQARARQVMESDIGPDVVAMCDHITESLPLDLMPELQTQWQAVLKEQHEAQELLAMYQRLVLSKVDERAIAEIAKFSSESVLLIALSPIAILDMLLLFWRNMRMIDKIAGLYGLKLGYWSRIALIKQVFINMVYAGGSELIADMGVNLLGADVLGKFSARLAQGAGAGMLTARLGIKTLKLCRPLPFSEQEPKLGLVRQQMLQQIKRLISKQ